MLRQKNCLSVYIRKRPPSQHDAPGKLAWRSKETAWMLFQDDRNSQ
jgi:hypothetical protein